MNALYDATSRAVATAETLVTQMREAAKLADAADPLFGEIFEGYMRDAIGFKNRLTLLDGAARRKAEQAAKEAKRKD